MPEKKKSVHTNQNCKTPQPNKGKSTALLDLEADNGSPFASSIESKLLFCKRDDFLGPQLGKCEKNNVLDKKPNICAVPDSDVLGKVKNFLGVISEANKKLQVDAKEDSEKYDIEVLNGDETELIEMDLMLGVADLHTPEAVAAAESALAGYQPNISLAAGDSDDDDDEEDDRSDDDDVSDDDVSDDDDIIIDDEDVSGSDNDGKESKAVARSSSSEADKKQPSKKQSKIVELS